MRRWPVLALSVAALLSLPAFADIKAYNAAVAKGDYKLAAAEAASTWPTLDKSRADIATIAGEFGYSAYVAGDLDAARGYVEFAAQQPASAQTDESFQPVTQVFLRLLDVKEKPGQAARDSLNEALVKRAALPGFDNISYHAVDAVIGWDLKEGNWAAAVASSKMGVQMAVAGGAYYLVPQRRMEMMSIIAGAFLSNRRDEVHGEIAKLQEAIISDMDAMASDEAAGPLAPVYWEARTWDIVVGARPLPDMNDKKPPQRSERMRKLLGIKEPTAEAKRCMKMPPVDNQIPSYVTKALIKGRSGAAILRIDTDMSGKVTKADVIGAVPERSFADAMVRFVKNLRFKPGKGWDKATCSLEETNMIVEFQFAGSR